MSNIYNLKSAIEKIRELKAENENLRKELESINLYNLKEIEKACESEGIGKNAIRYVKHRLILNKDL